MLIFQNGTAYFDEPSATTDIGENGLPIKDDTFLLSVPCYIDVTSEDRSGHNEDGAFPHVSLVISFDFDSVDENFNPSKVRVEHEHKGDMGIFPIQRIEFYNLTRTIQIWASK